MIKIIPTTKEYLKKFNLFGVDISIGFAKYAVDKGLRNTTPNTYQRFVEDVNYLIDNNEEDGVITHRFILWRVKVEIKSVVKEDFIYA